MISPDRLKERQETRLGDDAFDVWQQRGPWIDGDGLPSTYTCEKHDHIGRFYECAQCSMQQAARADALLAEARRAREMEAELLALLESRELKHATSTSFPKVESEQIHILCGHVFVLAENMVDEAAQVTCPDCLRALHAHRESELLALVRAQNEALAKLKSEAEEWTHVDDCGCSRTSDCEDSDGFACREHGTTADCPACECGRGTVIGIADPALALAKPWLTEGA